jgi:hypothetical protein
MPDFFIEGGAAASIAASTMKVKVFTHTFENDVNVASTVLPMEGALPIGALILDATLNCTDWGEGGLESGDLSVGTAAEPSGLIQSIMGLGPVGILARAVSDSTLIGTTTSDLTSLQITITTDTVYTTGKTLRVAVYYT